MRAKTLTILTLVLCFVPFISSAQLSLGIRAGYNASGILFTPKRETTPLLSPLIDVGIIAKYYDLKSVGFQSELNFTQQGYTEKLNDSTDYVRINSYANLPLFFQLKTSHKNLFAHLNLGFYASVMAYSQQGQGETGSINLSKYKMSILRDNTFEYGLIGGIGTGYDFKWGAIQLDIRYTYGFGDLYKHNYNGNPERSPAWRLNASLGILFNMTKREKPSILPNNNIEPPSEKL